MSDPALIVGTMSSKNSSDTFITVRSRLLIANSSSPKLDYDLKLRKIMFNNPKLGFYGSLSSAFFGGGEGGEIDHRYLEFYLVLAKENLAILKNRAFNPKMASLLIKKQRHIYAKFREKDEGVVGFQNG